MSEYIENNQKESLADGYRLNLKKLEHIIYSYHQATGLNVILYSGKSLPLIVAPEDFKIADSDTSYDLSLLTLNLLRQCDRDNSVHYAELEEKIYFSATALGDNHIAYLLIFAASSDIDHDHFKAAVDLLSPLAEYIVAHEYLSVVWQNNVELMKQIIWDNADADWSVDAFETALNVKKTSLYKQFHKYTGKSIMEFVRDIRMEKACYLLKNTDLSVSEISAQVGFYDYNYFCRTFKKQIGMPAKKYRKLHSA